jgi:hypothetical protein
VVSKAGLERLVEVLRVEHPEVAFTTVVVGNCAGGQGDSATGFADHWDWDLAGELHSHWAARGYVTDKFIDVEDLVRVVDSLLRSGPTANVSSIVVAQPGFQ